MDYKCPKKFSIIDYKENMRAFRALEDAFKVLHPVLRPEDYDIDVDVYLDEASYQRGDSPIAQIELEVKRRWRGSRFPYRDVQFPRRKVKYIDLPIVGYWVLFNEDCSECGIISLSHIKNYPFRTVNCSGIGLDDFKVIPVEDMVWGIENLERKILADAFMALNTLHQTQIQGEPCFV